VRNPTVKRSRPYILHRLVPKVQKSSLERFTDELRTPDACGLVRSSRLLRVASQGLSSALKGRSSIARGVNPGNARRSRFFLSPEGASVAPGGTAAPSGRKRKQGAVAFPGLTPRAIDGRPFRAEEGQRTSATISSGGRGRAQANREAL